MPGIDVRTLHEDQAADRMTFLVRMSPGARYPAHHHTGVEECYVLSGDVSFGPCRMTAGDYQVAEGGSDHAEHVTEGR